MSRPLIIAHRGASGYLPEHSRGAKALAYGMGADFLEQDVIATRDGELVVLHDLALDAVSDVRRQFPGRARADGRHYVIDFELAELRTLRFHERADPATGRARYPSRYPPAIDRFHVVTLAEEIAFVEQLNASAGRATGIYPEIKNPEWHADHGFDLGNAMADALESAGYLEPGRRIFLQCFDPATLKKVRARVGRALPIIQLISSRTTVTDELLDDVASYANGIGPSMKLVAERADSGRPVLTSLVDDAHVRGLVVHPYTFRADELPDGVASFEALLDVFVTQLGVDGLFTDFPDRVARYLQP